MLSNGIELFKHMRSLDLRNAIATCIVLSIHKRPFTDRGAEKESGEMHIHYHYLRQVLIHIELLASPEL